MPSDVYTVIPAYMLPFPGKCWTCGSNERDCVDFKFNTEYDGAVLVCVLCIKELAKVEELGLITRDSVEHVVDANAVLMLQLAQAEMAKKELRNGVVAVLDSYDDSIANLARDYIPVPESDGPVQDQSVKSLF
jgi:hypothetical protein